MSNKNKSPLITLTGDSVPAIVLPSGEVVTKKVVAVNPVGSQVLVELLTYDEQHPQTGSLLTNVNKKFAKDEARHGWVRKIGPSVKSTDWSFKEGDRVLISGSGTPVPNFIDGNDHEWVLLEPYTIKAVLEESY
jgi:hypothetical protein